MGRQSGRTRSGSTGPPSLANCLGAAANGEPLCRGDAEAQRRRGAEACCRRVRRRFPNFFLGELQHPFRHEPLRPCASAIRCCCCRSSGASARFAFRSVAQTPRVLSDERTANSFVAEAQGAQRRAVGGCGAISPIFLLGTATPRPTRASALPASPRFAVAVVVAVAVPRVPQRASRSDVQLTPFSTSSRRSQRAHPQSWRCRTMRQICATRGRATTDITAAYTTAPTATDTSSVTSVGAS